MATKNQAFYAHPLFSWLLIFTFTPIGLYLLWVYKHHHFLLRVAITLYFIPHFQYNFIVSLGILGIIVFETLNANYNVLERLGLQGNVLIETFTPVTEEILSSQGELSNTILKLFEGMDYRLVKQSHLTYFFKKGAKDLGIKVFEKIDITKDDVIHAADQVAQGACDQMILITNASYTLFAEEMCIRFGCVELWDQEKVLRMFNSHEIELT